MGNSGRNNRESIIGSGLILGSLGSPHNAMHSPSIQIHVAIPSIRATCTYCYVNTWCLLSCAWLSDGVRLLIIILAIRCLESLASSIVEVLTCIGQIGITLWSSHQLDKAIWNVSLSCCVGCSDAEAVCVVFACINLQFSQQAIQ